MPPRSFSARNPDNARQVVIELTERGRALQPQAGCLGEALLAASGQPPERLGALNRDVSELRDALYGDGGKWSIARPARSREGRG